MLNLSKIVSGYPYKGYFGDKSTTELRDRGEISGAVDRLVMWQVEDKLLESLGYIPFFAVPVLKVIVPLA